MSKLFGKTWKYFIAGIVMFCILIWMAVNMGASPARTVIQVVVGSTVYFVIIILLRAEFISNIGSMVQKIIRKE